MSLKMAILMKTVRTINALGWGEGKAKKQDKPYDFRTFGVPQGEVAKIMTGWRVYFLWNLSKHEPRLAYFSGSDGLSRD